MTTFNFLRPTNGSIFLVFSLFIFNHSHHSLAQGQSLGGGIGINSLFGNGVNFIESQTSRVAEPKRAFGKVQTSLNLDYNFPNRLNNKFLGKIYNPIFSNPYLQLRGQLMFNQFKIAPEKNNSVMSFGGSVLCFPAGFEALRKTNFFVETGYKAAWNNAAFDPFNCLVVGIGTRHNIGDDWFLQTNLSYTFAFNDYIDQFGLKGFTTKKTDGYALFNVSILRSFMSVSEKKVLDRAKDSLGMARSFSVQAIQKGQKVMENTKSIQKYLKPLLDKTKADKAAAIKLSETALDISNKATATRLNLKKNKTALDWAEMEMDSLKTIASAFSINRFIDNLYKKSNETQAMERDVAQKIQELQHDIQEARQNMKLTFQYLPTLKELETETQRINFKEGGEARVIITKADQAIALAQKEFEMAQNGVKETIVLLEKADKNLKTALDDVEKTKKEIVALRK